MLPGMTSMAGKPSLPAAFVRIADGTYSNSGISPTYAWYILKTNGTVDVRNGTTPPNWLLYGTVGEYEARATLVSGTDPGNTGSWLSLASERNWGLVATSFNTAAGVPVVCSVLIEIRKAAAPYTVLDSATINLSATWN